VVKEVVHYRVEICPNFELYRVDKTRDKLRARKKVKKTDSGREKEREKDIERKKMTDRPTN